MEFIKKRKMLLIVAAVLIVAVIIIVSSLKPSPQTVPATSTEGGNVQTTQKTPSAQVPASSGSKTTTVISSSIFFVTPAAGDVWVRGKIHSIRWSHASGYIGYIVLVNASTREVAGWITPDISSGQVMYDWDTTYVSPGKTSVSRQTVAAGTYVMRTVFNNPRIAPIESAPFEIAETGVDRSATSEVFIQSGLLTPNILSVKQGTRLAIINGDAYTSYNVLKDGVSIAKLSYGDACVFDTTSVTPGSYEFKIEKTLTRLILTVTQ